MAKYNLVRNGYFDSLTTSGTGNVDLNWSQLETLMDGNLTSSGVTLTSSGVLYLEVDLSQRIKVDGIRLYADDLSKISNIKFYSKNAESDSYTTLITQSGTSYYYTTITSPSAPRFVRATISGVGIDLYEFQIFNDDYIVAFGADGSQYSEYLDNTPVGELGIPEVIKIFNNDTGSIPADAYACIDYTENDADWYVKISNLENGTYYGFEDGAVVEDNDVSNNYIWDMGTFDGTMTDNSSVLLSSTIAVSAKLGHLPNGSADEAFRTGANTWDWDRINKKMYVMGLEGTALSLWDYDYTEDAWNYLTNLAPAVAASDRFAVMCYCNGGIYVISQYTGTFGKYTISGAVNNWTNLANPTFSYVLTNQDRVSMCSDGVRYIYALTSDYGQSTSNRNFKRFDTISGTWSSMDAGYQQYPYTSGGATGYSNTSCLTYDYDKDRVYLINASEEWAQGPSHYIQLYNVSANSWGTTWFDVTTVYNTDLVVESIWYHNKWLYVSCNPNFDTGYFFRYNLDTTVIEKINLGYEHYNPVQAAVVGVYMIAIDNDSIFGASVYFAQISADRTYLYGYNVEGGSSDGTYTSPIFKMDNKYNSSYFVPDITTTSGINSVSYDAGSYNGTIRVRSSDAEPTPINEVYWTVEVADNVYLYRYNLDTGVGGDWLGLIDASRTDSYGNTDVDRRTGHIASTSARYYVSKSGYDIGNIRIYDRSGSTLYSKSSTHYYRLDRHLEFDKLGGLWGYEAVAYHLLHFDYQLAAVLADVHTGSDFLYDLAAELNGQGIWYTDDDNNVVVHRNSAGTLLHQITLLTPRAICGTNDNGCWVIDNDDYYARRYTSSGTIFKSVYLGRNAEQMCADYNDGFWYYNGGDSKVYHVNSEGTELVNVYTSNVRRMRAMSDGCMVWSRNNDYVKWVNNAGAVVRTINGPSTTTFCAGVFHHSYDDYLNYQTDCLPDSDDTVWGTTGSAEWKEVRSGGYFLPTDQYHQVELTLRTTNTAYTPYVNKLLMAPAVKITDIQAQSSKDMYIRTDIPSSADIADYETRLKVWWGAEE